jgi:hypothetical protein
LQTLADVGFGDPAAPAQLLECFAQASLNAFEHHLLAKERPERTFHAKGVLVSVGL